MILCINCGTATSNPRFCSRSCAATVNNKLKPKRIAKVRNCLRCGCQVPKSRTVCEDCLHPKDITLGEAIYTKHHQSSAFALVRSRARVVVKGWEKTCKHCGYSKHVEVCHIKAISEYPLDTKLSVINNPANLLLLCPNCHWEFDNILSTELRTGG